MSSAPVPFQVQWTSYVSGWKLEWSRAPRGPQGKAWVRTTVEEKVIELEVHWVRDAHGIRLISASGVHGFDLRTTWDDSEQASRQVHDLLKRNSHLEWSGVQVSWGDQERKVTSRLAATGPLRVKSQMPGKIVKILVELGTVVQKDQPMILMEAMKMENEIRAPRIGRVSKLSVVAGQAVESGAELMILEDIGT